MKGKIDSKLPAFTIIELIVAMILTAIVMAVGFVALSMVMKQMKRHQDMQYAESSYNSLRYALFVDIDRSNAVRLTADGFDCLSDNNQIHYFLTDSFMVRATETADVDTFHCQLHQAFLGFERVNQEVYGGLIDELVFTLSNDNSDTLMIAKKKEYDAATLTQLDDED